MKAYACGTAAPFGATAFDRLLDDIRAVSPAPQTAVLVAVPVKAGEAMKSAVDIAS